MSDSDLIIHAINFSEGVMSISYAEGREQGKTVGIARTMYIATEDFSAEIEEVLDSVREIIDRGLLLLRNPPQKARSYAPDGAATRRPVDSVDSA